MNYFIYFSLKWASDPARKSDRGTVNLWYLQQVSIATPFVSDKYLNNLDAIKAFNYDDIILIGSISNVQDVQRLRVCDTGKEYLCPPVAVYSSILDEQDDPRLKSILSSREIGFANHVTLSLIALEKFENFVSPSDLSGFTVNNYADLTNFRHPFQIICNDYPFVIPDVINCVRNSFQFFAPFLRHFAVTVPEKEIVEAPKEKKLSFKPSGLEDYAEKVMKSYEPYVGLDQAYPKSISATVRKVKINKTPAIADEL